MIKMIAADLDGTLLGENHMLNEVTYQAIRKAQMEGIRFVVVTGRDYAGAIRSFGDYNIECDWIVASGAEVRNSSGEILHSIPMDRKILPQILECLTDLDLSIRFCVNGADYVIGDEEEIYRNMAEEAKQFLSLKENERIEDHKEFKAMRNRIHCIDSLEALLNEQINVYKVFISSPDLSQIERAKSRMLCFPGIASASSFITNVEITDARAQKGVALEQYIQEHGIAKEEVMVFGDSMNDYSMLSMDFGATIAMENGMEEIREVAKYVTKSNEENGVAYVIEELLKK